MILMPQNNNNAEAGNVFFLILAGVALFAALAFTFSNSGKKGTGNLSKNQARVAAQEILNYARLVESGVDRVRRNGCSESEISFENSVVAGYANADAPVDNSCHVFESDGGKTSYSAISQRYLNASFSSYQSDSDRTWGEWIFGGRNTIPGVGTDCSANRCKELLASIHFINRNICIEINKLLGIPLSSGEPPPENSSGPPGAIVSLKFTGSFHTTASGVDNGNLVGSQSACLRVSVSSQDYYFFYHTLLAR